MPQRGRTDGEVNAGNSNTRMQESGSPSHRHHDRPNAHPRQQGNVSAEPLFPLSRPIIAMKAARKTFAIPQSNSDFSDDEPPNTPRPEITTRNTSNQPFIAKSGTSITTTKGKEKNEQSSRRVTFSPDTRSHTSVVEGRSVPIRGGFDRSSLSLSQTRNTFASKSVNHVTPRRDPFGAGITSSSSISRAPQLHAKSRPGSYSGSQISDQRRMISMMPPTSSLTQFPDTPTAKRVSGSTRHPFPIQSFSSARRVSPPTKSRPLPPLEAVEDATWRKGLSPRKSSVAQSGIAPRMIAASVSANRKKAIRSSTKGFHLTPDDVGPPIFVGRDMKLYVDDDDQLACESDIEKIPADTTRQRNIGNVSAAQVARKGNKQIQIASIHITIDTSEESSAGSSDSSEEDTNSDADESHSDHNVEDIPIQRPISPPGSLVAALEPFTLSSLRMQQTKQLPFLLRNLTRGFIDRCRLVGVTTLPTKGQTTPIEFNFRLMKSTLNPPSGECLDQYNVLTNTWSCPLCDLHGIFINLTMLQKHIEWDHSDIGTAWSFDNEIPLWKVILIVLEPLLIKEEFPSVSVLHHDPPQTHSPHRPAPSITQPSLESADVHPPVLLQQESPVHSKLKNQPLSPPRSVTRATSQTLSSRSRSRSSTATGYLLPSREPSTKPPLDDPLGPAAQYPYLSEATESREVYFSCRPGGPRIYDLLNTLSLAPFGILSWYIVDREEEMFENDDVLDEDKVMQALWGRWIMLNHRKFLAEYYQGTKSFIDEYWEMIHRAAGWAALRAWLLMFVGNRFLTGSEVANLLRHYESLTKMKTWSVEGDNA